MTTPPPLWESDPTVDLPNPEIKPSPVTKRRAKRRERYANRHSTDVIEWLRLNEPQNFDELMDLRRALYSHQTIGKYQIKLGGKTLMGEVKMLLTGPTSAVLILSNKCRHFLLRTLCRLRRSRHWPPIKYR